MQRLAKAQWARPLTWWLLRYWLFLSVIRCESLKIKPPHFLNRPSNQRLHASKACASLSLGKPIVTIAKPCLLLQLRWICRIIFKNVRYHILGHQIHETQCKIEFFSNCTVKTGLKLDSLTWTSCSGIFPLKLWYVITFPSYTRWFIVPPFSTHFHENISIAMI